MESFRDRLIRMHGAPPQRPLPTERVLTIGTIEISPDDPTKNLMSDWSIDSAGHVGWDMSTGRMGGIYPVELYDIRKAAGLPVPA